MQFGNDPDTRIKLLEGEALLERAFRIKPLLKCGDEDNAPLGFIHPYALETQTFCNGKVIPGQIMLDMERIGQQETLHQRFSATTIFRPTLAEVLSQIPEKYLQQAAAFYVELNPARDLTSDKKLHRGLVHFYSGTLPLSVAVQPVIYNNIAHESPLLARMKTEVHLHDKVAAMKRISVLPRNRTPGV